MISGFMAGAGSGGILMYFITMLMDIPHLSFHKRFWGRELF